MILFDLKCTSGHVFEAWFRDSAAYEAQRVDREIFCPLCGDNDISKAPMAPRFAGTGVVAGESARGEDAGEGQSGDASQTNLSGDPGRRLTQLSQKIGGKLAKLRASIEENFDYVGDRFPEEARRIHYGESKSRDIYGEATEKEAEDLAEEGIKFSRIPFVRRRHS